MAESVLADLVARHEVLRTQFEEDGVPAVPVIRDQVQPLCATVELPAGASENDVVNALIAANAIPFTLDQDPLIRAKVFRIAGEPATGRFWWLITVHHLVADQRSLELLAAEIAATLRGENVTPPDIHYPDYVAWQRDLPKQVWEPQQFYWKWQLRGRLSPLELPTARPRQAVHVFAPARHTFRWNKPVVDAVRSLARESETSPVAVSLAVFKLLLHRYAQQAEIVIGTRADNRRQEGTESVIGPVSNLVVLRSTLSGDMLLADLIAQTSRIHREACDHQEMPFDSLVQVLNPAKDMSRTALFDVLATVQETPAPELDGGAVGPLHRVDLNLGHGKYDLALHLEFTREDEVAGTLTYNSTLHDEPFVAQLSRHFTALVETAPQHQQTPIADIPLLTTAEEAQQLSYFNDTAAEAPREHTLVNRLERQVDRAPDRVAVQGGEVELTYAELDHRANQLARRLIGQGVTTDTLVAVALPRSAELVVALLAVLKSGGAYLPLDPHHPVDRIRFTLEDSGVGHLVSRTGVLPDSALPATVSQFSLLDCDAAEIAAEDTGRPAVTTRPGNLAYCIYTSGSTGRPKGVLIEHRQVVRLMETDRSPFDFGSDDVWSLFHSTCFDFSVWEMYGALLFGGKLIVLASETTRDPEQFAAQLLTDKITVLNQTPSAFRQVDEALARRGYPALALRQVIFGGEALAPLHLKRFAEAYPHIALINMYGITETTVHVTHHRITDDDITLNRPIIGRPLPTTTTLVLDSQQRLLPLGVAGEICIGGEGLARGYLNRPELTREKFIDHPYQTGARLYRSGDRGALQPNGNLHHLGRMDDQVQVRGFRVELGEIRTCLLRHSVVTEAEVVARETPDQGPLLTAYLVTERPTETAELRAHAGETLPDYMIPHAFVPMNALPLTANGKVDRKALPDPAEAERAAGIEYSAPINEVETFLARNYAKLLSAEEVGRDHHFFELGGHSLLAAQLVSRLREEYQIELPLKHVFSSPTVAALAEVIARLRTDSPALPASDMIPRAARRPAASLSSPEKL